MQKITWSQIDCTQFEIGILRILIPARKGPLDADEFLNDVLPCVQAIFGMQRERSADLKLKKAYFACFI